MDCKRSKAQQQEPNIVPIRNQKAETKEMCKEETSKQPIA